LGKTIQAIACSLYYRSEWPLLIICPSSMKYSWRDEILKWTRDLETPLHSKNISMINTKKDRICQSDVYIMSYAIATSKEDELLAARIQVVIVDESHAIKSWKSNRTKVITRVVSEAKRRILLSGTPMNNRPAELHPQINALRPREFMGWKPFTIRYCDGHKGRFAWEAAGATHCEELHALLKERVMIRREKANVLDQLPSKQKTIVFLDVKSTKELKDSMKEAKELRAQFIEDVDNGLNSTNALRGSSTKCYMETGKSKVDSVCQYILEVAESGEKFLVFCHHKVVMDKLEDFVKKKVKVGYMRIDGKTSSQDKNNNVKTFQNQPQTRIALLSITAAGTGLTLTAASIVIFAELYWSPSHLLQCEDRVHRIGQKNFVNIYYLLGKSTLDDLIWPMVERKLEVTGTCLAGQAKYMNIHDTEKYKRKSDVKSASLMAGWLDKNKGENN